MSKLELLTPATRTLQLNSLEYCIRQVLTSRQLPHHLETEIQALTLQKTLSRVETMLLEILHDAIAEEYVVRVQS